MELIFVHGALVREGQWWWQRTADLLLERTGIRSRALALPSTGETSPEEQGGGLGADAAALRAALDEVDSAIIVGHSYGGTVIAEAGAHPAVAHLLSIRNNRRVRIRCHAQDDALPVVPSLTGLWSGANWFEREAFDLFGIVFEGHPDLRRILTDYGFVGHPFRKDFPLIGNVEVRYDEAQQRVIYEPVTSVEPRVLVPRVIRDDSRYDQSRAEDAAGKN